MRIKSCTNDGIGSHKGSHSLNHMIIMDPYPRTTVTAFDKACFAELANAAWKHREQYLSGHRFALWQDTIPTAMHDALMADYRAWLIDGVYPEMEIDSDCDNDGNEDEAMLGFYAS